MERGEYMYEIIIPTLNVFHNSFLSKASEFLNSTSIFILLNLSKVILMLLMKNNM